VTSTNVQPTTHVTPTPAAPTPTVVSVAHAKPVSPEMDSLAPTLTNAPTVTIPAMLMPHALTPMVVSLAPVTLVSAEMVYSAWTLTNVPTTETTATPMPSAITLTVDLNVPVELDSPVMVSPVLMLTSVFQTHALTMLLAPIHSVDLAVVAMLVSVVTVTIVPISMNVL